MKKKKISGKLILNKNTVANLSIGERRMAKGGAATDQTCGEITCMGTNCETYNGCQISESCLHMCYTEKLYETCNPLFC